MWVKRQGQEAGSRVWVKVVTVTHHAPPTQTPYSPPHHTPHTSAAVQARAAWQESELAAKLARISVAKEAAAAKRMSVPDLTSAAAHEGMGAVGGLPRPVSTGSFGMVAGGSAVAGGTEPPPPPPGGRDGVSSAGAAAAAAATAADGESSAGSGAGAGGGGGGGNGGGGNGGGSEGYTSPSPSSHGFGESEEPPPLPPKPPVMFMVHIGTDASQATSYVEVSPGLNRD